MSQIYNINEINDKSPFRVQIKQCNSVIKKQCLTSIMVEGIRLVDFSTCFPENDNVFIYENHNIKLQRDPSVFLTWNNVDEYIVLSKEGFGYQTMTIGYLENTNFLVIYLGTDTKIDATTKILTLLPKGLGFFPMNFDHLLPIELVKTNYCDLTIQDNIDKIKPREFYSKPIPSSTINNIEGFSTKQKQTCWIYFIILLIILFIIYKNQILSLLNI